MSDEQETSASSMRSLGRALDVIDVLARSAHSMRLVEVARECGLHRATTQRILKVLELRQYAEVSSGRYSAGPALLAGAQAYLASSRLVTVSTPVLQEVADALGLTASISVRLGSSRVLVARVEGSNPLRYRLPLGGRLPLHLGAGKVFLAHLPDDERAALLDGAFPLRLADGRVVERDEFVADLDRIRDRGYGVSVSERVNGVVSVSAPVLHDGAVLAVMLVSAPAEDLPRSEFERVGREVARATSSVSDRYA